MYAVARFGRGIARVWRQAICLALAACLWLSVADVAWAKPPKKEPEAAPTKSYTIPYMIVLAMLGIGLMTACRPTSRLDKPDEKIKEEEAE